MTGFLKSAALSTILALGATTAGAVTYDFTTSGTQAPVDSLRMGNFTVTAGAEGLLNFNAQVTQTSAGLGVRGTPDLEPNRIDGRPVFSGEYIKITFDWGVRLLGFRLGDFDDNDDYLVSINDGADQYFADAINAIDSSPVHTFVVKATGKLGEGFLGLGGNDDFTLASVDVAPVPLPAGIGLLAGALGALGLVRRSRRKA